VGNLWLLEGFGRVLLIKGGALGTPLGNAQFTHPWEQIASMTVAGGRLFAGQISGAGILVWDAAAARSGPQEASDWQLANLASWAMVAGGNRLYALDAGAHTRLAVWNDLDTLSAPRALDVLLEVSSTQAVGDLAWRDNALIALVANGVTENRLAIYADSGALTPTSEPDTEVAPTAADYLQRSYLDRSGNLYILDTDGIYIYRDGLTDPTLVTKLTTFGSPVAFAVID
jgi:hypothetical protein